MKNFQEMISGEIKNRKAAIKWLGEVTETIKDVCYEMYGSIDHHCTQRGNYALSIWKEEGNKRIYNNVYFRHSDHRGANDIETPGFYSLPFARTNDMLFWGEPIENLRGNDFWRCVRQIKEWLPFLESDINRKIKSRTSFVKSLIIH